MGVLSSGWVLEGAERPDLPGPGLDVPVDLDGDGVSTFGDVCVFNESGDLIVFEGIVSSGWSCNITSNSATQIYVRDTTNANTWEVSVDSSFDPGDLASRRAAISSDGSRIAFSSKATNFDPDSSNTIEDIYHVEFDTGTGPAFPLVKIRGIDSDQEAEAPDGNALQPALDATGTHIAFASTATNLVDPDEDPDSNGKAHVYLHHLESGLALELRTHRMSLSRAGTHGDGHSTNPDVGLGGRAVVYQSVATNFLEDQDPPATVSSDTNGVQDVFESRLRAPFNRGDAEPDGSWTTLDMSRITNWLSYGTDKPPCVDAADVDDNGSIQITDAVYFSNWAYGSGPAPPSPHSSTFSSCGFDPTDENVTCKTRPSYCTESHSHSH